MSLDPPAAPRQVRLEQLLFAELQYLIHEEAADPGLHAIHLVGLTLSPDGGTARVAYAVVGALDQEHSAARETKEALARANRFLRTRLASNLHLKRIPTLGFTFVGMTEGTP